MQLRRLLGAPGKAVDHPAQSADATDRGDHGIDRTAGVHDHRQVELAGEAKLAVEVERLRLGIEAFDEVVQPAFADRQRAFALDPRAQCRQVFRAVRVQVHRMQAVGGPQAGEAGAGLAQLGPTRGVDRRDDLRDHARRDRAGMRGGAVGVELRGVEVAVAVDQAHVSALDRPAGAMATCASSSWPAAGCRGQAATRPRTE